MGLSTKANQLTGPTATGNQSTTDPGFQPKALFTWHGLQTANGAIADAQFTIGVGDTANTERAAGYNSDDAVTTSDSVRHFRTGDIIRSYAAGTTTSNLAAVLTTMDATGFTLNWGDVTLNSALYNYLAIGGTDITNTNVGSFASNTVTGNQAVTGVGFTPDIVILFATLQTANGVANNNSQFSFGVMTPTGQWSTATKSQNGQATMNTSRAFYNDHCFTMVATASNIVFQQMAYVSMDSDGFTVNIDTAGGSAILVGYMAIKGGQWKVGTETQKTSTGTKATTGIGFAPSGVILASVCDTQTAGTADNSRFSFGASTGSSNNTAVWTGDADNTADSVADTIMSSTKCIVMATEATLGAPTTQAEANINSLDSDGFTLNWTTADGTARVLGYVAFGAAAGVSTLSISVSDTTTTSESVSIVLESLVNKSETVTFSESINTTLVHNVTVSDTATFTEPTGRLLESRINVTDSITVTDTPALLIPTLLLNVNDSVTITESTQRLLTSFINVSDTATTSEASSVGLANTITVSDTATFSESTKALLESNVNKSDSITITESATLFLTPLIVNVSDNLSISESVNGLMTSGIAVSDTLTTSESLKLLVVSILSTSDTLTLSENIQRTLESQILASDTATASENIGRLLTSNIASSDLATISENVSLITTTNATLNILIAEILTFSESVTFNQSVRLNANETISFTELAQVTIVTPIPGGDGVTPAIWVPGNDPNSATHSTGDSIGAVTFSPASNIESASISSGDGVDGITWIPGDQV